MEHGMRCEACWRVIHRSLWNGRATGCSIVNGRLAVGVWQALWRTVYTVLGRGGALGGRGPVHYGTVLTQRRKCTRGVRASVWVRESVRA